MRFYETLKAWLLDGSFNYTEDEGCRCGHDLNSTDGPSSDKVKSFLRM